MRKNQIFCRHNAAKQLPQTLCHYLPRNASTITIRNIFDQQKQQYDRRINYAYGSATRSCKLEFCPVSKS